MAYKETDIVVEGERYWVLDDSPKAYLFLKYTGTHSTVVSTIGKGLPDARERAIKEFERREALEVA